MRRNLRPTGFAILVASTLVSFSCLTLAQVIPAGALFNWTDATSCQPFIPAVYYLANTNARSLVAGDFNGDGILDFAVATLDRKLAPTLTILLGKKDGTFVPGKTYAVGSTSIGGPLAVSDFNGDGKLDIVTANSSEVVVFLGNGDGTFQASKASAANETIGIAVGDFNQDGKLDLAIAEFNSVSDVQVLLGNGDGTFRAPANYPVTAYPTSIAVADFNRDGHLDLAVANGGAGGGNTVSVLLGNGDGTFHPKVDYVVGYEPSAITAADFNGDGTMDIATADYISGTASVLLNKGDGTFRPAASYAAGHPYAPYSIAAASLEPGSKPSLAVATIAGTYILVNNGNGTFKAAQGYEPNSTSVVVTDFNKDGKADLAVAGAYIDEGGSGGVTIIFGKGHGVFVTPTAYVAAPNLGSVTVGDFNGDGIPDLAAAGSDYGGPLAILLGKGKGRFSEPIFYNNLPELGAIASGDFNRDGKLDLAIVTGVTDLSVQILLGNGNGTFTPGKAYRFTGGGGRLAIADFNGDGTLDIAVSSSRTVSILLGRGDGTFKHTSTYPADGGLVVADFNGDGKLDLAVTDSGNSAVNIYSGYGNGTFKKTASYSMAFNPSAVAAADFNGDGKVDLAVGAAPRMGAGDMEILLGNGHGTFQPGTTFNGGYAPVAADFNGDGKVDLATINIQGLLQVLFGNGDGTFTAGMSSSLGQFTDVFTLADLDGDGAFDLVVPNDSGGEVSVLLNQCAGK